MKQPQSNFDSFTFIYTSGGNFSARASRQATEKPNYFNQHKSRLKLIELGFMFITTVVKHFTNEVARKNGENEIRKKSEAAIFFPVKSAHERKSSGRAHAAAPRKSPEAGRFIIRDA
jgi:hypothetical protein